MAQTLVSGVWLLWNAITKEGGMLIRIKRICSWCNADLGTKVVEASQEMLNQAAHGGMPVTGGICNECAEQLRYEQHENP